MSPPPVVCQSTRTVLACSISARVYSRNVFAASVAPLVAGRALTALGCTVGVVLLAVGPLCVGVDIDDLPDIVLLLKFMLCTSKKKIRDADQVHVVVCCQESSASPTNPFTPRDDEETEDCLFLSVYTPSLNPPTLLPTIVWLHGGGYVLGFAGQYDGADLVQESNNKIVVVIIQYRLGLFGFLAGEQVKEGGALNAGLLDQDFALRWVHDHIDKFGGDKNLVTIWGESAGAGSVLQQVVAHNGATTPKLFRAAITSSTFLPSQYNYNDTIPQVRILQPKLGMFFSLPSRFPRLIDDPSCNGTDPLGCLRTVDSATLGEINMNVIEHGFQGTFTFVPVVDGSFIVQSPTDSLIQGKVNGSDEQDMLLSVTNTNEGIPFINQSAQYNVAQYVRNIFPLFGVKESLAAAAVYHSLGSPLDQVNAIMGESIFKCPTYSLLEAFPKKAYKSQYAIPPALHSQDVINYFPDYTAFNSTLIYNNSNFINAFTQGFLSFVVNLNPNDKLRPSITPPWAKWSTLMTEMLFNRTEGGEPYIAPFRTSSALLVRCAFWKSVRHLMGQ
ncbi:Carboxylic ester hydrolase [Mycena sanguinolenta]|uniref:Carboxylic ester hydrolase n=1 Tax=Mycena sanguinolenta TaxID=230812 RepID=A0A8H6XUA4_9AGAR|nr:Carboxylic ester hydrolase [Mycena sanguinolenta]